MYLLNLKSIYLFSQPIIIYLHSTMYLLNRGLTKAYRWVHHRFTFHYVSIKSCVCMCSFASLKRFTFHYVSIKSRESIFYIFSFNLYLHSTMYLLNRFLNTPLDPFYYQFTFHYVSIKSAMCQMWQASTRRFTFHYVSIKSALRSSKRRTLTSFTFHYVSIKSASNSVRSRYANIFTFHYVSIKSVAVGLYVR